MSPQARLAGRLDADGGVVLETSMRSCTRAVVAVTAGLVVLGPVARVADYLRQRGRATPEEPAWWARLFDLSTEANLPTWWAAMLLAALAAMFALAALLARSARRPAGAFWGLAAVAALLSVDEGVALHEQLLGAAGDGLVDGGGFLHFTWIVPGAVVALVVGLALLRAAASLPAEVRLRLAAGGAAFLAGALGVEAVSGAVLDARGHDRWYLLTTTVEEGLEVAGVLVALAGARRLFEVRAAVGAQPGAVARVAPHVELRPPAAVPARGARSRGGPRPGTRGTPPAPAPSLSGRARPGMLHGASSPP